MVRWLRWHCPPDTRFENRALAVWDRARYLSVTEAPHNIDFHTCMGKKHFCFIQTAETGNRTLNSGVKGSGANHYTLGPPPCSPDTGFEIQTLEVWARARYFSVTEAPHNTEFLRVDGEETFLFLSNRRDRETLNDVWTWTWHYYELVSALDYKFHDWLIEYRNDAQSLIVTILVPIFRQRCIIR